jgi:hypothetical protein
VVESTNTAEMEPGHIDKGQLDWDWVHSDAEDRSAKPSERHSVPPALVPVVVKVIALDMAADIVTDSIAVVVIGRQAKTSEDTD